MSQNNAVSSQLCRGLGLTAEMKAWIARLWSLVEPVGDDLYPTVPHFQNPFMSCGVGWGRVGWRVVSFVCFVPLLPSSPANVGLVLKSCLTSLPSSAWPKISCDLRSLISSCFPPAALTPFGHVAGFWAPGITTWISSETVFFTQTSVSKYGLN